MNEVPYLAVVVDRSGGVDDDVLPKLDINLHNSVSPDERPCLMD